MTLPPLPEVLDRGLAWLFTTEHPAGAMVFHLGSALRCRDNRTLSFCPGGGHNGVQAVVGIDVTSPTRRRHPRWGEVTHTPLAPDELDRLSLLLAERGYQEADRWNGFPATSGSIALAQPLHPSMQAALDRYRAGCAAHGGSVFCGCAQFQAGYDLLTPLRHPPVPMR
ncbi:MAG TPA: hypothetical protein VIM84_11075 [Gemmatimonadales bacterium]